MERITGFARFPCVAERPIPSCSAGWVTVGPAEMFNSQDTAALGGGHWSGRDRCRELGAA